MGKEITYSEAKQLNTVNRLQIEEVSINYRYPGLYVLEFDNGVKIGISKNIKKRLVFYRQAWCKDIRRVSCFSTYNPALTENYLKRKFKKFTKKESSEYFYGNLFNEIVKTIKKLPTYKNKFFYPTKDLIEKIDLRKDRLEQLVLERIEK